MEKALQQRLVGAIALVALGVILIPALLDGSGYKSRQEKAITIPEKPEFPPLSQTRLEPIPTPVEVQKQAIIKKKVAKPAKPIQSWALQVGTFSSESNANGFRDKLRKAGHPAYVEKTTSGEKTSYRVRVGPELDKKRVEALKTRFKNEWQIEGFIVSHPG